MTYAVKEKPGVMGDGAAVCNAAILRNILKNYPKDYKNWTLRAIFSVLLISYFCYTIYKGPVLILITTLFIQVQCFSETIDIGFRANKIPERIWFRCMPWYFLVVVNYFMTGEVLMEYFGIFIPKYAFLRALVDYHRFLSFCMYFLGLTGFLVSLVRKHDMQQFSLLIWTHVALILIVVQSYMVVKTIFEGLIWLILPITLVSCNDITAFIFGKLFGRTSLTPLSPKKTWEGFMGAAVSTVAYGNFISFILCKHQYFICPIEYIDIGGNIVMSTNCTPSILFQQQRYKFAYNLFGALKIQGVLLSYPFVFHAFCLSLFAALVAPIGGIFASGLKRAFHVKDFAATIPGHGGILDRFDCQYLMITFVNVYITSFIKAASPEKVFAKVLTMDVGQQIEFYRGLEQLLSNQKLLNVTN